MAVKIQSTTNYEIFQLCLFNRDTTKLDNLKESMKLHGFIPAYPLHCNINDSGKLSVKAGHHRLESAKALGLPVFYVVSEDSATVHELERASRPWSFKDFVESHARSGSESHMAIIEFAEKTGISLGQVTSLLCGESASSHNRTDQAKNGTYAIKDSAYEHANKVGDIVIALNSMGIPFARTANFVSAICSAVWVSEFDSNVFVHRVAANMHLMVKQSTVSQFLDLIDRVYNHCSKNKIALAFLAKQAAKERSIIYKHQLKKQAQSRAS